MWRTKFITYECFICSMSYYKISVREGYKELLENIKKIKPEMGSHSKILETALDRYYENMVYIT